MNGFRLIVASLIHHRRVNLAVMLGVAAATAVLTGALIVGDSVKESLRDLTLDRLGRIDEVLVTDRFFRVELADEIAAADGFNEHFSAALPAVLLQGSLQHRPPDDDAANDVAAEAADEATHGVRRASGVTVLGVTADFWELGEGGPAAHPGPGEIVLNQPLAGELGVGVGDELSLRIPRVSEIPADSALGKKSGTARSLGQLKVSAVVPASGLGRFGLLPTQQIPLVAYLDIESLQEALQQPGRANGMIVAGRDPAADPAEAASRRLAELLRPRLTDYGLQLEHVRIGEGGQTAAEYFNLGSTRMLLDDAAVQAVTEKFADDQPQPVLTYLANTLAGGPGTKVAREIPYSTITAIDNRAGFGPLVDEKGDPIAPPSDDQIVLNSWTAGQMQVKPGDRISVTYFEPESTHGKTIERTDTFTLAAVAPLAGPDDPPTPAGDKFLTPRLPGVTDQRTVAEWDAPFPFDQSRVKDPDEQYWEDHRTTPKAFVSLAAGRKLWASRFGNTTSIRFPLDRDAGDWKDKTIDDSRRELETRIEQALDPASLGFVFQPVKRQGLAAAGGTTPFAVLFLLFSFFIIAAALMLVLLLFRLGIDQRAEEIGSLLAAGWRQRKLRRMLIAEGFVVADAGALVGVVIGVGHAWLMVAALTSDHWWRAAISTPFLKLHVLPLTLVIGYAAGMTAALLTIAWSLRQMRHVSVRRLLSGQSREETGLARRPSHLARNLSTGMLLVAAILGLLAIQMGGEAQIGAFFASGTLVLAAGLTYAWWRLTAQPAAAGSTGRRFSIAGLAARNGARSPARSTLTIGLVASASFLIVAISAFRLDSSSEGAGGYQLWATSDVPILHDLNTADGRYELGIDEDVAPAAEKLLAASTVVSLRVHAGEDASCLNLNQTRQPRVLGATPAMIRRGGFLWASSAARSADQRDNPWRLLEADTAGEGRVGVVLDQATAMYSLHKWGGVGERFEIEDDRGGKIPFEIVGLLKNSIFQGDILMSEENFKRYFPEESGYRLLLVDAPLGKTDEVSDVLENQLGDFGVDAVRNSDRLESFLAVQNTYLSTFQSLGGLGLLLGTFGLATVQLRSVLERRRELALMRAAGFRRGRLAWMVMLENAALLIGGLATGIVAAAVAILPHLVLGGASVPFASLGGTLTLVLVVGLLVGLAAVRAALAAPLLSTLRGG